MKQQSIFALFALVMAACSSAATGAGSSGDNSSGGSSGSSGSSGTSGGDVPPGTSGAVPPPPGTDSGNGDGFDFVFTNAGANTSLTSFKVAQGSGSQCMGQAPNRSCSFVAAQNANGCSGIFSAAFVGTPTVGMSYPIVVTPTTPPGNAEVSYSEFCGQVQKMWKATGGTLKLDKYAPPSGGMGSASFTLTGATLEPEANNPGQATGNFSISGKATNVQYSAAN